LDEFNVLRGNRLLESRKEELLVPLCVAENPAKHTYRFDQSEAGCAGLDQTTGINWTHRFTAYTSKDATGPALCVGVADEGNADARWMISAKADCGRSPFKHKFSFRSVGEDPFKSPFQRACMVEPEPKCGWKLASGDECNNQTGRVRKEIWLQSRAIKAADEGLCQVELEGPGLPTSETGQTDHCSKPTSLTLRGHDCAPSQGLTASATEVAAQHVDSRRTSSAQLFFSAGARGTLFL